ncbi:PQQ-binding-like beta-propeller repeat protein [Jiangella asiatica]|uniref:outer membrane protein assembly factor BamB family protein n=1 Tax=Jiangella asiatica TaxID=2530372 RepID=UPI0013A5EB3B|nr:PQQ-binding-like beta-propeller repeat protein [Jiangella asiatica]
MSATLGGVMSGHATATERTADLAPNQAVVWGHVFDDRNGNDLLDPGERRLAGVTVSDGQDVAVTDATGRFELTVDTTRRDGLVVFVTVPSGWAAAPDADMIPRFYRHVSVGAGEQIRVDLALRRDRDSDDQAFRFLAVSDPHVRPTPGSFPFDRDPLGRWRGQIGQFNRIVANAAGADDAPRFLCVSGDVTEWGLPTEFDAFRDGTRDSQVPVWPVLGNHEYPLAWWTAPWTYGGNVEQYRQSLGPEWYSFGYGGQHFVVLDNMLGAGQPDQLAWLERDLARNGGGKQVVVMFHAPFVEFDDWVRRYYPDSEPVAQSYLDLLGGYDTTLVLSGHAHVNRVDDRSVPGAKHVNSTSSYYSLDQTPLGFRVVDVGDGPARAPYRMFGVDCALTLVHPAPGARVPQGAGTVQISAYDTTSVIQGARYRLDGEQRWRPLRPAGPWTWTARENFRALEPGTHRWTAEVRDHTGRRWQRSGEFTVVAAGGVQQPAPGAPWPMFHGGPARGGHAIDEVAPPLRLAWSHGTGGTILTGSPVVSGDTAYIGVRDEDGAEHCGVVAVDLATGERRWRTPADSLVEATLAADDGRVFTTSVGGRLRALDAATGTPLWEHDAAAGDPLAYVCAYSSLAVAAGMVLHAYRTYRVADGMGSSWIVAHDVATGAVRWRYTRGFLFLVNDNKAVAVGDGRIYVNPGLNAPWAIDLATGTHAWSAALTVPPGDRPVEFGQGPLVYADGVVLATFRDAVSKGPNAVEAFDARTGAELWRYLGPADVLAFADLDGTAPAVAGTRVYASLPSGVVAALDLATGAERWRSALGAALLSSPAVSGSTLYVGANDGHLYALDAADGTVRWRFELGSWVASSPAVTGNLVLTGAWDGHLYCFVADD